MVYNYKHEALLLTSTQTHRGCLPELFIQDSVQAVTWENSRSAERAVVTAAVDTILAIIPHSILAFLRDQLGHLGRVSSNKIFRRISACARRLPIYSQNGAGTLQSEVLACHCRRWLQLDLQRALGQVSPAS
jgi:hypothetical protein